MSKHPTLQSSAFLQGILREIMLEGRSTGIARDAQGKDKAMNRDVLLNGH
jgi:hypothetical protein